MRRSDVRPVLAWLLASLALTACGPATGDALGGVAVDPSHRDAGLAGGVVDCRTWGDGGAVAAAVYGEGATAGSPWRALEVARGEGRFGGLQDGLGLAAREDDRALYVIEVDDVVKQAVVVRDGPATRGAGGPGWYVESWAVCDASELPAEHLDEVGVQVWTDADGSVVPTTLVQSSRGPEHCGWESMTLLQVGPALGGATYVGDPLPELRDFVDGPADRHVTVPADARDTGYARRGDHLWLAADGRRAYVGSRDHAQGWPRASDDLACS